MPSSHQSLSPELLRQAILASNDGVSIVDMKSHEQPLIFVNHTFEQMTGYLAEEVIGKNCNFLQGAHTNRRDIEKIRSAITCGKSCDLTLRNYRKSGEQFWNRLSLSPVTDASGKVSHYIGIQKDVTREILLTENLKRLNKLYLRINETLAEENETDILTGLNNRRYLENAGKLLLANAQREHWTLSVYLIDVDDFKHINDRYGHPSGDICLQHVASSIKDMFSRDSDICVRYGGDEFLVITTNHGEREPQQRADELKKRIGSNKIHTGSDDIAVHVSVGAIAVQPAPKDTIEAIIHNADIAMYQDKGNLDDN